MKRPNTTVDDANTEFSEYVGVAIITAGLVATVLLLILAPPQILAGLALAILTYLAY